MPNLNHSNDREFTKDDRLKKENEKLKREVARLRKIIDRLDLNNTRFKNLKDLVGQQVKETQDVEKTRKDWTCFECSRGVMKIHVIDRRDGTFYWRSCSDDKCGHRTKIQRYSEKVEKS